MGQYDVFYNAVEEIYDHLKLALMGPSTPLETLTGTAPLDSYVCGMLWPMDITGLQHNDADVDELLTEPIDDAEDPEDPVAAVSDTISNANLYKPTSMGITVMLPESVDRLHIEFCGAKYLHEHFQTGEDGTTRTFHQYNRTPFSIATDSIVSNKLGTTTVYIDAERGVRIMLSVRSVQADGNRIVTVTVQNTTRSRKNTVDQSIGAIFQCELSLRSETALAPVYQSRSIISDIDEMIGLLQYRDVHNYACGHSCAVEPVEIGGHVYEVRSEFVPRQRVHLMTPGNVSNTGILSLDYWKDAQRAYACDQLTDFVNEYVHWRQGQPELSPDYRGAHQEAAAVVAARIDQCIKRLMAGIATLRTDDNAWAAFRYMNAAMLLQRVKTKNADPSTVRWYPFQIAYILQIIPDVCSEDSKYRQSTDLLWFPTGGGKTEAYLGVAAFVIFYRRLCGKTVSDGVTVIMRYTLRLLTIQQFERATAMICACEHIRQQEKIGGEISIGLWIGSAMTPNNVKQASEALEQLRDNKPLYEGSPVQISKCPWCGHPIDLNGYEIRNNALIIRCADNPLCEFHTKLPIYVVDDDIYRARPTLLLSTVDKFARLAWEEKTCNLFGAGCPPPELIIQDELHLISGPLGSLAGIYETAVEYLCERGGQSPKIIASTATVRHASEQIRNLYGRDTIQFPPAGITYEDSFFAVQADESKRPARTYIGVCEAGGSVADLLIRVYAVLFYMKALFVRKDKPDEVIDQYFTTVGYFNALRDLGASSTIIQDRIFTHVRELLARTFKDEAERYGVTSADIHMSEHSELTSRRSSKEIKNTLDRLGRSYSDPGSFSYVLSSNMLSVGIDIDRLGVMTVYNQPKSNAEYIQATSRVGRRYPGAVITLYNNMRSRDKSHYEQFCYYHRSFYRYVEATSVTPFSCRAIEKALHCVFVAMIRLTIPELSGNNSARYFRIGRPDVEALHMSIVDRIRRIAPAQAKFADAVLCDFSLSWQRVARENSNSLCYRASKGSPSLLVSAEEESELDIPKTLNSLRNVDPSVNVFFRR